MRRLSAQLFASTLVAATAAALPPEIEFFEKQVRPVLAEQCYKCHGPEKQKADLRLDSREALLKGGDQGAVVVLGKPEESSLIKSIRHEGDSKMPEKAPKMPEEQIAALSEWVKMGAPWPADEQPSGVSKEELAKTHWSFQPIRKPPVPQIAHDGKTARNEVDAFLLEKLQPAGLALSPATDKRTLLRRANFDLVGLPPTAEEVAAFEADSSPDAFSKVIDRLLASPHYGERWGRFWLDVARYADSKGYVFQEERKYPFAYTYRDWVIRAFNEDLPYDQFITHQLAADFVAKPEDSSPLAAMGFLTVGRRFLNNIHDIIDDRIDLVTRGVMGLTVACARCHDHKFDPITQKDYYALYGVFASSQEPGELPRLPAGDDPESDKYKAEYAKRKGELDSFLAQKAADFSLAATLNTGVPLVLATPDRDGFRGLISRQERDRIRELRNKLDQLNATGDAPPRAMVLVDAPNPVKPRVFLRGNAGRPGDEVDRRFIAVLAREEPKPFEKGSGRLELAQAIVSPENPLTARVLVNRVWSRHFGRGVVRTPGDFGVKGEPPTHPELLDWLAARFMEDRWSIKKLHRLIMLSAAYQQTSDDQPGAAKADPENRLVARQNRQRLDFEAMRDSLLCVTGNLETKIGGRPVDITQAPFPKRRTVYGFIDRQNLPGVFRTFDFASPDATSPQRYVTTVPQQALFMLNSPFVIEQARALVKEPDFRTERGASEWQVQQLYETVLARRAEPHEIDAALQFIAAERERTAPAAPAPIWQYGYGWFDAAADQVIFQPLPHFTGTAWQGGPKLPHDTLGWVTLNADGGHTGDAERAAIRRWTAPRDAKIEIRGTLARPSEHGDGVEAWIISSRDGELLKTVVEPKGSVETRLEAVQVKAGDTLDFIVSCRGDINSDSFNWAPQIRGEGIESSAKDQFSGAPPAPEKPLSPWEKYAQVLLSTNEFIFVD